MDLLENAMNKALEDYINKDTLFKCLEMENVDEVIECILKKTEYKE